MAIDLPTFNALTDAFVRNGRLGQAEAVLEQMAAVGMEPSTRTFNTLLKVRVRVRVRVRVGLGLDPNPNPSPTPNPNQGGSSARAMRR